MVTSALSFSLPLPCFGGTDGAAAHPVMDMQLQPDVVLLEYKLLLSDGPGPCMVKAGGCRSGQLAPALPCKAHLDSVCGRRCCFYFLMILQCEAKHITLVAFSVIER